jgi:hypothetical protein
MTTCSADPYVELQHKSRSESGGAPKLVLSEAKLLALKRRKDPVTWPLASPNLTTHTFLRWSYKKNECMGVLGGWSSQTADHCINFRDGIKSFIGQIYCMSCHERDTRWNIFITVYFRITFSCTLMNLYTNRGKILWHICSKQELLSQRNSCC